LVLVGSIYYYRQEILRQLGEFDLKIWGDRFDWLLDRGLNARHTGRALRLDEKARAVRAARIALNPLHYAEVDALNCRAFELAGCGAFQLISSRPVLDLHFRPGEEVETFSTADEMTDKIRHYLRHPEQAAEIAERGRRRAHAEHSYEARLGELFAVVDRSARANQP
jgi:spore maturation protein CgeB